MSKRWTSRLVRALAVVALLAVIGVVAAELFARYYLGLGDPPLSMVDAQTEYRFVPGEYSRFGNRVFYNDYSMRADPAPKQKQNPDELRILVMGDSVVNGGALTDHDQLASTLLQQSLRQQLERPVWVGHVSAGSWSPDNLLAYVEKFGWFDADLALLVISSHDALDIREFHDVVGVRPAFPDQTPWLAVQEGFNRYLPRYIPALRDEPPAEDAGRYSHLDDQAKRDIGVARLAALLEHARANGVDVIVWQHPERSELTDGKRPGHAQLSMAVEQAGITPRQLDPVWQQALDEGQKPYRDNIHINPTGQRLLFEQFRQAVDAWLAQQP